MYYLNTGYLSGVDRYFCFSKRFSRPMSCSSVNTVRLRRPFLVLLPPSAPCSSFPRRCRSRGRWWDAAPTCSPGAADSSGEPSEQDSGDMGNLRRLVWSAFSTWRDREETHGDGVCALEAQQANREQQGSYLSSPTLYVWFVKTIHLFPTISPTITADKLRGEYPNRIPD